MKQSPFSPCRFTALFLCLAVGLPPSALALRETSVKESGLEEDIAKALGRSVSPAPSAPALLPTRAAGAEEITVMRDTIKQIKRIGNNGRVTRPLFFRALQERTPYGATFLWIENTPAAERRKNPQAARDLLKQWEEYLKKVRAAGEAEKNPFEEMGVPDDQVDELGDQFLRLAISLRKYLPRLTSETAPDDPENLREEDGYFVGLARAAYPVIYDLIREGRITKIYWSRNGKKGTLVSWPALQAKLAVPLMEKSALGDIHAQRRAKFWRIEFPADRRGELWVKPIAPVVAGLEEWPKTIDEWLVRLADSDPYVRYVAMDRLGRLGVRREDGMDQIARILKNEDEPEFVRVEAARLLGDIGKFEPRVVASRLLMSLNETRSIFRVDNFHHYTLVGEVLNAFGKLGEEGVPLLLQAARQGNGSNIDRVIGKIIEKAAILGPDVKDKLLDGLIDMLDVEIPEVGVVQESTREAVRRSAQAIRALGQLYEGEPKVLSALSRTFESALRAGDVDQRSSSVIYAFEKIGHPALPSLESLSELVPSIEMRSYTLPNGFVVKPENKQYIRDRISKAISVIKSRPEEVVQFLVDFDLSSPVDFMVTPPVLTLAARPATP